MTDINELGLEAAAKELLAHGEFGISDGSNRRNALVAAKATISAYLSALAPQAGDNAEEPVAWVIPGSDNARADGFIDAMAWQEGEFSRPLYAHPCTSTPVLSQNAPALEDKG
jgi:hypothetical protein